jgi:hypothetical protein
VRFNQHYSLKGMHAFLAPSNYAWIRYDEDQLVERFSTQMAARRGSELHDLAENMIRLGIRAQPNKANATFATYVNDAIQAKMTPEQTLFYSENCFGHADAIGFRIIKGVGKLRIYDLKTGLSPVKVDQLLIYAALFCLEYDFKPFEIEYDLRIYQNAEVQQFDVDPDDIVRIMDRIVTYDKLLNELKNADN